MNRGSKWFCKSVALGQHATYFEGVEDGQRQRQKGKEEGWGGGGRGEGRH